LEALLEKQKCSQKELEVLRGKLQFMESQTFGRVAKALFRNLFYGKTDGVLISEVERRTIVALISWLNTAEPRWISPSVFSAPVLVFSDGACEPGSQSRPLVTCGALIINPNETSLTGSRQLFGFEVRKDLTDLWMKSGKRQLVTEAELYAFYSAIYNWRSSIARSRCLFFIDSEPAFFAILRGTSDVDPCAEIVHAIHRLLYSLNCFPWFVRIPSKSNPADLPSRLHINEACIEYQAVAINAVQPDVDPIDCTLFTFHERGGKGKQSPNEAAVFQ
jgi:hypothetical protein